MTTPPHRPGLGWNRRDWLALVLLAALVLLFHWQLITPNPADRQSYPPGDFSAQFWAFSTFEARELSAGRLPLWNPYTFAGAPFWADAQSAVLYPFSLLALALSGLVGGGFSLFALEMEAVFHFWLAGSFMYLFARRITQSRAGGLVAALVFAFGGYLTGYPSQQLAVLEVDVWLPLILFFVDRAFLRHPPAGQAVFYPRPRPGDALLAGLAWGIAILAGHPQSWMLVGYTVAAYALFLILQGDKKRRLANGAMVVGVGVLGAALAAVQLLPAIEYTLLSVRAKGVYETMSGGLPLVDSIQLLLPGVVSLYSPLYVGVVGLLLALFALFYRRTRFTLFWGVWGGLALVISFGGNTFLYSLLYLAGPGFSIFRGQERWAFGAAFSLAVLAGYGMRALGEAARQPEPRQVSAFGRLAGRLFVGSLGLVVAFFYGLNSTGWSAQSQFYPFLSRSVFLAILLALAWGVIRVANRLPKNRTALLLGALIAFDLFSVNWKTNLFPQPPEWHTQKPAVAAAIEADAAGSGDLFRVYNEFRLYDNYGIPFELQDLWGASPLRLARYEAFLAPPMLIERAWALLNVKYVITWRSELYVPSTIIYRQPGDGDTTYVHRLDEVGPRAWLAHRVETMPEAEMAARLAEPGFDAQQTVLVAGESPAVGRAGGGAERVAVDVYRPNRIEVEVTAQAAGLLVLSEVDYPGWRATVDGQPARIVRVDSVLRGVPVGAGRRRVTLVFAPPTFWLGAAISGLALLYCAAMIIFRFRRMWSPSG